MMDFMALLLCCKEVGTSWQMGDESGDQALSTMRKFERKDRLVLTGADTNLSGFCREDPLNVSFNNYLVAVGEV